MIFRNSSRFVFFFLQPYSISLKVCCFILPPLALFYHFFLLYGPDLSGIPKAKDYR